MSADPPAAWDALPTHLDTLTIETGIAVPPEAPTALDAVAAPVREEITTRLAALGLAPATPSAAALLAAWIRFAFVAAPHDGVDRRLVTPGRWEALLALTVLERPIPPEHVDDELGERARQYRMKMLGFPTFADAPRYPGLFHSLQDLGLPGAAALGTEATARSDAWVADQLDDLERLVSRVRDHLEDQPPPRRTQLEQQHATLIERLVYVDTLASGWMSTGEAVRAHEDDGSEGLELASGGAAPLPEHLRSSLLRLHGAGSQPSAGLEAAGTEGLEGLEAAAPAPALGMHTLGRMLDERQDAGLESLSWDEEARQEELEALLDPDRPGLASQLKQAWKTFGGSVWEGLKRAGRWLKAQWDKVVGFFRRLPADDTPPDHADAPLWHTVMRWLGERVRGVLKSVSRSATALTTWVSREGRVVEVDGQPVGGFDLDADFDIVLAHVDTPDAVEALRQALVDQRTGFVTATKVFGVVIEAVVAASTGGASLLTWRLLPRLAHAWRKLKASVDTMEPVAT